MKKRILITGGCGFVGRNLLKGLSLRYPDASITVVDNYEIRSGYWDFNKVVSYFKLDTDKINFVNQDCREYFKANSPDFDEVYHLAAVVGGRLVMEEDPLVVATDLSIDSELFYWLSKSAHPYHLHYFSSSAAYPISYQTREVSQILSEDQIAFTPNIGTPDISYGWSKLTGEFLARSLHRDYGGKVVCYRPFSGYGPDQDLSYPFPALIKKVLNASEGGEVIVWGTGSQCRDFIHIDDIVELVCDFGNKVQDGSAINISCGKGTSFNELVSKMADVLKKDIVITNTASKPEGVFYRVGDTKLQNELGFYPKVELEEGIMSCVVYRQNQSS